MHISIRSEVQKKKKKLGCLKLITANSGIPQAASQVLTIVLIKVEKLLFEKFSLKRSSYLCF